MGLTGARPRTGDNDRFLAPGRGLGHQSVHATSETPGSPIGFNEAIGERSTSTVTIRLRFIVFCDEVSAPTCAATPDDVSAQMAQLNEDFDGYGVEFERSSAITFTAHARFYDFCGSSKMRDHCFCESTCRDDCNSEERDMKRTYAREPDEQINVYVVANLQRNAGLKTIGYRTLCGDGSGALGAPIVDGKAFGGNDDCETSGPCRTLTNELGRNLVGLHHMFRGLGGLPGFIHD